MVKLFMFIFQYSIINVIYCQVDEAVVKTIISVLTAEEQAMGLQQPLGIGQRPRPMTIDHNPTGNCICISYAII
jgi:hypothetical protein